MTTIEHQEWTKTRIAARLRQFKTKEFPWLVDLGGAESVCIEIREAYCRQIAAIEMAASQATNDMVAELMALRAELAALQAGDMTGHLDDDEEAGDDEPPKPMSGRRPIYTG